MKNTHVSIIEDHADTMKSLVRVLSLHDDFTISSLHDNALSFLEESVIIDPGSQHILLLDIGLPRMSGIESIPHILNKYPEINIIILSGFEEEHTVLEAIRAGACSYISKKTDPTSIITGINIVRNGGSYMSPSVAREIVHHLAANRRTSTITLSSRQREILERLADGKSYASIATELFVSVETVRTHVKQMYKAMKVANKTEAVTRFVRGEVK